MNPLNRPPAHAFSQWCGSGKHILIAAGLAIAAAAPAWAKDAVVDPQSAVRAQWRAFMAQNLTPADGCFHASYPDVVWQKVACKTGEPRVRPWHSESRGDAPEITGGIGQGNNDYVAESPGLIAMALGNFEISGVLGENGIAIYNNPGSILGANEYSIQLNTNKLETTSACAGHSGCRVWQQFVYATDYIEVGEAAVFMQYWLLDWGNSTCPSGFGRSTGTTNCYRNSTLVAAPDVPVTALGSVALTGSATAGGSDLVLFMYDSEVYSTSNTDSVLDISSVWNKAEFNVLGNGGGARALFNYDASVTVNLALDDGTISAPTCVAADGTSGESNNMTVGACTVRPGIREGGLFPVTLLYPYIQFTESNSD
jgi:hypothetical protein